jgi:uncharacterized glyoxalase superfamily protein PhnB
MQRAGGVDVTPTLPVADMTAAVDFYEAAGFDVRRYGDGFAFVTLGDQSVFDLGRFEQLDPATNGAGCYLITHDVDAWHQRLVSAGLDVTPIADMPWGMHEFTLTDPNRNRIRIGRASD